MSPNSSEPSEGADSASDSLNSLIANTIDNPDCVNCLTNPCADGDSKLEQRKSICCSKFYLIIGISFTTTINNPEYATCTNNQFTYCNYRIIINGK